MSAPKAAI